MNTAHGTSQPRITYHRVAGILDRNRISNEDDLMKGKWSDGEEGRHDLNSIIFKFQTSGKSAEVALKKSLTDIESQMDKGKFLQQQQLFMPPTQCTADDDFTLDGLCITSFYLEMEGDEDRATVTGSRFGIKSGMGSRTENRTGTQIEEGIRVGTKCEVEDHYIGVARRNRPSRIRHERNMHRIRRGQTSKSETTPAVKINHSIPARGGAAHDNVRAAQLMGTTHKGRPGFGSGCGPKSF
ncbi:hypothetical protein EVAR_5052_1 [Eumeta japonica]|uniref:Uncharacterized protein n=1 Tax=Eumeta variegata TaxID=151549 RepID=A0A4C1SU06_EUMVA|nr:hypothetical protein EVAR_5052_1 [Eumeta japonica]